MEKVGRQARPLRQPASRLSVFYVLCLLIGSLSSNEQRYVGMTTDLKRRLILDPVPNILPILWVLAAYAIALFRKYPASLAKG